MPAIIDGADGDKQESQCRIHIGYNFVIVIAVDFSNAFDRFRLSSLLQKLVKLDIPDHVYH